MYVHADLFRICVLLVHSNGAGFCPEISFTEWDSKQI